QISAADGRVPLRRLAVHRFPIMLAQHLYGVVGFSEPTATLLSLLLAARRLARVAGAGFARDSGDRAYFERIKEGSKRMNSCVPPSFNRLGFRLSLERGFQVSVCGDLLNVFLKEILLFPGARTGRRERIRVPAAEDFLVQSKR